MNRTMTLLLALGGTLTGGRALGDTFGSGANSFAIDFVTIGSPGNPADTTGSPNPAGSVAYSYRIGKYEISRAMIEVGNAEGGLGIAMADLTPFGGNGPNRPATGVSWIEAAKFVNWLNTSTGSAPAYKFDGQGNFQLWTPSDEGYDSTNLFRNSRAKYFLPSVDEWYKAAYYDPSAGLYWDYPTATNSPPIAVAAGTMSGTAVVLQGENGPADVAAAGGLSAYGTMAQGGNVSEREETAFDMVNDDPLDLRGVRGSGWDAFPSSLHAGLRSSVPADSDGPGGGFRVASRVPEPSANVLIGLLVLGAICITRCCRLTARTKLPLVLLHEVGQGSLKRFAPPAELHQIEPPFPALEFANFRLGFAQAGRKLDLAYASGLAHLAQQPAKQLILGSERGFFHRAA